MSDNKNNKENSRRKFLQLGIAAAGAAAMTGGIGINEATAKGAIEESGEKVRLLSPEGKLVEIDKAYLNDAPTRLPVSNEETRKGMPGKKFVMVIDLAKCRNARKCVSACQHMHYLPTDQEWISVYVMKDSEDSAPYWFPKPCFHCDHPPCVKVCPVGATFKREDGIVLVDNERCIGCKFCMTACPYSTRVFNWKEPENIPENVMNSKGNPETSVPQKLGTVGKCDFCPDMIRMGKLPDCVTACPNGVIYFGDQMEDTVTNGDETIRFSELIKEKAGYRYMEELGTEPRVYYLPPTDRMFPFERGLEDQPQEILDRYKNLPYFKEFED
jgi:Fe-S-cluster-containing dehydrogenase component